MSYFDWSRYDDNLSLFRCGSTEEDGKPYFKPTVNPASWKYFPSVPSGKSALAALGPYYFNSPASMILSRNDFTFTDGELSFFVICSPSSIWEVPPSHTFVYYFRIQPEEPGLETDYSAYFLYGRLMGNESPAQTLILGYATDINDPSTITEIGTSLIFAYPDNDWTHFKVRAVGTDITVYHDETNSPTNPNWQSIISGSCEVENPNTSGALAFSLGGKRVVSGPDTRNWQMVGLDYIKFTEL